MRADELVEHSDHRVVASPDAAVTAEVGGPGEPYDGAGTSYADVVFRHQVGYRLALHRWRQSFRWIRSFSALFSSAVSAYNCFRREFSCSSSFIRLRSDG